jgi:hypothetical protein
MKTIDLCRLWELMPHHPLPKPIVGDLINFESCEGNVNEEKKI